LNKLKLSSGEVWVVEGNVGGTAHSARSPTTDMFNFIVLATNDSIYHPPSSRTFRQGHDLVKKNTLKPGTSTKPS